MKRGTKAPTENQHSFAVDIHTWEAYRHYAKCSILRVIKVSAEPPCQQRNSALLPSKPRYSRRSAGTDERKSEL